MCFLWKTCYIRCLQSRMSEKQHSSCRCMLFQKQVNVLNIGLHVAKHWHSSVQWKWEIDKRIRTKIIKHDKNKKCALPETFQVGPSFSPSNQGYQGQKAIGQFIVIDLAFNYHGIIIELPLIIVKSSLNCHWIIFGFSLKSLEQAFKSRDKHWKAHRDQRDRGFWGQKALMWRVWRAFKRA